MRSDLCGSLVALDNIFRDLSVMLLVIQGDGGERKKKAIPVIFSSSKDHEWVCISIGLMIPDSSSYLLDPMTKQGRWEHERGRERAKRRHRNRLSWRSHSNSRHSDQRSNGTRFYSACPRNWCPFTGQRKDLGAEVNESAVEKNEGQILLNAKAFALLYKYLQHHRSSNTSKKCSKNAALKLR